MNLARVHALAVVALLACGCHRTRSPCSVDLAATVELRDGEGALELSLRAPPIGGNGLDVCDGGGHKLGSLHEQLVPRSVVLLNAAGDAWLRLDAARPDADPTLSIAGPLGTPVAPMRLHPMGDLVRFLDAAGLPVGQVGRQAGKTITFDPAGTPLAYTETVESRRVVSGRDGAVKHYAIGIGDERAAAAFALEVFKPAERLAIARFLDSP